MPELAGITALKRQSFEALELEEDPLLLRLDFHGEAVYVYDYGEPRSGEAVAVRTKMVGALDVAHALARQLAVCSPVLPANTLWWGNQATGPRVAIWRDPQVWQVKVVDQWGRNPKRMKIPLPGLVFLCLAGKQAPYTFAAPRRPVRLDDQLYHCPALNVFDNGRICTGSHDFPDDPARVPDEFFRSFFSANHTAGQKSKKYPEDILRMWQEVSGKSAYPIDDLIPQLTLGDTMKIES